MCSFNGGRGHPFLRALFCKFRLITIKLVTNKIYTKHAEIVNDFKYKLSEKTKRLFLSRSNVQPEMT